MDRIKLVSVIIPSYKRAETLERAINSVLAQTYKNIEVIVVDDNIAGDEYSIALRKIIEKYSGDSRVILVTQPKHINGAEARNAGLRASHGEWIAYLDDDDEWLPTKLEKQMRVLSEHTDCMGVSCLYNEYMNGELVHSCPPYNTDDIAMKIFSRQVAVFTSTVLLNKDKLIEFGAFNNSLKRHQDLQLLLDFTSRNKMTVLPEYLVKLHLDSGINRPSLERIVEIKKDFFNAMNPLFQTYSSHNQRLIRNAHYYEIVFAAIKERNLSIAIKYLFKAGISPTSIKMLMQRFRDRKFVNKTNCL